MPQTAYITSIYRHRSIYALVYRQRDATTGPVQWHYKIIYSENQGEYPPFVLAEHVENSSRSSPSSRVHPASPSHQDGGLKPPKVLKIRNKKPQAFTSLAKPEESISTTMKPEPLFQGEAQTFTDVQPSLARETRLPNRRREPPVNTTNILLYNPRPRK